MTGADMLKEELKKILKWLEKKITSADLEWLIKNRGPFWENYKDCRDFWHNNQAYNRYDISLRIQDILDAKAGRIKCSYGWAGGLPKSYVLELTSLMKLANVPEKASKRTIINLVLQETEEKNK